MAQGYVTETNEAQNIITTPIIGSHYLVVVLDLEDYWFTDSSKLGLCQETSDLKVSYEGSLSWHNWEESVALQVTISTLLNNQSFILFYKIRYEAMWWN